ncbi:hypothetical protein [Alkaliphilus hydrothermalis]|uniref:Uncharacterized protein n=1 Tax=Alkaliphilus hydrothermalis TaxID=1482730 RepID=A0ABS2NR23_9FIRM|nr:hypothetical protein [Alkaliphilus hydrothermalis]MBM7615388.1 hypothetical protein [Alkaliphilus hydrothermalis]
MAELENKKVNLKDAMKQMLESKKQGNNGGKNSGFVANTSKQSQHTKKPNNQRRKTGGS